MPAFTHALFFCAAIAAAAGSPEGLDALLSRVDSKLNFVVKRLRDDAVEKADIWTNTKRTIEEQEAFKAELIGYYQRGDSQNPNVLTCMVLNRPFDRRFVIASHIWKSSTRGKGLEMFNLTPDALNDPRNGILVAKGIEEAFDNKHLCFIWDASRERFIVKLLNPGLRHKFIDPSNSTKFHEIHGRPLLTPRGRYPFRRIVGFHAKCAYRNARLVKWITEEEFSQFEDYSLLSEGAAIPSGELEWDGS